MQYFKERLVPMSEDAGIARIDAGSTSADISGTAKVVHQYWQTPPTKALLAQLKAIRFADDGKPRDRAAKDGFDWTARIEDALSSLERYRPDEGEAPGDYYHQKCTAYRELAGIVAGTDALPRVLQYFAGFLWQGATSVDDHQAWYLHLSRFLRDLPRWGTAERAAAIQTLKRSPNPVISAYLEVQEMSERARDATRDVRRGTVE